MRHVRVVEKRSSRRDNIINEESLLNILATHHKWMKQAQRQETKDNVICQLVMLLRQFVPSNEAQDKIEEILREYNSEDRIPEQTGKNDMQQQIEACRELAPETLLHYPNQPWKALEFALRTRNFENKKLVDRVAELTAKDKVTLSRVEGTLLAELLDMASNEFSNHGCNDFELDKVIPGLKERRELMRAYNDYNGSTEDFEYDDTHGSKFALENDAGLMGYLADRVRAQLESNEG